MRQLNAAPILMATLEAAGCGSDTPTAELATLEATEAATPEPTSAAEDPEPYDRFDMWIELGCPELWKAEGLAATLSRGDVRNPDPARVRKGLGSRQRRRPASRGVPSSRRSLQRGRMSDERGVRSLPFFWYVASPFRISGLLQVDPHPSSVVLCVGRLPSCSAGLDWLPNLYPARGDSCRNIHLAALHLHDKPNAPPRYSAVLGGRAFR